MKVPVIIQHGERRSRASLVLVHDRTRTEIAPAHAHGLHVPENLAIEALLSVLRHAGVDGEVSVPVTLRTLAEHGRGARIAVEIGAARTEHELAPGQEMSFVVATGADAVIELTLLPAAAADAPASTSAPARPAPRPRPGRKAGKKQVKPRRKPGARRL
jgi:hypothetical protein